MRVLAATLLVACGASAPMPALPTIASLGCLDVSIERVNDAPIDTTVLEWRIENTCDYAVPLDLAQARVFAIGPLFARAELIPRTSRDQLAPGWIDGGEVSYTRIRYIRPAAAHDITVEVELTAFYEVSHRPVIISALPTVAAPRESYAPPTFIGGGESSGHGEP